MKHRKSQVIRLATLVAAPADAPIGSFTIAVPTKEWDGAVVYIDLTVIGGGNIELRPEVSFDGVNWYSLRNEAGAQLTGGTTLGGAAAVGRRAISVGPSWIGSWFRVNYIITTGPATATIDVEFTKRGGTT